MSAARLSTLTAAQAGSVAAMFAGMLVALPMSNFVRVMTTTYATTSPLGFGAGPSRFSPLPVMPSATPPYGVVYAAADLATAVYETIVRDGFDMDPARVLTPAIYGGRSAVNVSTTPGTSLNLLDLTRGKAARSGVPTDVIRHSKHDSGQHFSEFVHRHMPQVDGFLYASRFTEVFCVAVFDRALQSGKLVSPTPALHLTRPLLVPVMRPWNFSVI